MRQIVNIFRLKRREDSEDSEKPGRYVIDTEDDVSEAEPVRDSNYAGSDLYWEQRFYQVKPPKPPEDRNEEDDRLNKTSEKDEAEVLNWLSNTVGIGAKF